MDAASATIGIAYGGSTEVQHFESVAAASDLGGKVPVRLKFTREVQGVSASDALERAWMLVAEPDLCVAIGHSDSRGTMAACQVYADHGVPLISPEATNPNLAQVCPDVYRLAPSDAVQAEKMVDLLVDRLGLDGIAIFHVQDEYGHGLKRVLEEGLQQREIEIVGSYFLSPELEDPDPLVRSVLGRAGLRAVVILGRNPHAHALVPALHAKRPDLTFLLSDGVDLSPALREALGAASQRCYATVHWHATIDSEASRAFLHDFRARMGRDPTARDALRDDALRLALRAVDEGGARRQAVRSWLDSLGRERPPFPGATGAIDFTGSARQCFVVDVGSDRVLP